MADDSSTKLLAYDMRLIIVAIVLAVGLSGLSAVAWAQETPATPEILGFTDGVLSWTDESDNEEGFRILVEINLEEGQTIELQYEIAGNVTSFKLPANATDLRCPGGLLGYTLIAFNEAGESPPSAQFGMACPSVDFMGPERLPINGTGLRRSGDLPPLVWLFAAGLALCALGCTLRLRRTP